MIGRCLFQVINTANSEFIVDEPRCLGTETGNHQKFQHSRRYLLFKLFMDGDAAGGEVLLNPGGQIMADPRNFQQFLVREGLDLLRQSFEIQRCPSVSPDLEDVIPFEFLDIRYLRKYACNLTIFHRFIISCNRFGGS